MLWCDSVAPLGKPVVPLVYWMLIGSSKESSAARLSSAARWPAAAAAVRQPGPVAAAQVDHLAQARQVAAHLLDHRPVVAGLELLRADQQGHAGLATREGQLVAAVGRVDVDQDRAHLRGGVLQQDPLGAVGRPDAHPVARRDPGRDQAAGQRVGIGVQPRVRPAPAAGHVHQRLPVAEGCRGGIQVGADRLAEQRLIRRAVAVGRPARIVHGDLPVADTILAPAPCPPEVPPEPGPRPCENRGGGVTVGQERADRPHWRPPARPELS